MTGPERVREAIRRDRGEFAPSGPVTLCGPDDAAGVLYIPVELVPDGVDPARFLADFRADLARSVTPAPRVELTYRADWTPAPAPIDLRYRWGRWVGEKLICPGCLAFRFGPIHLMIRLMSGRH